MYRKNRRASDTSVLLPRRAQEVMWMTQAESPSLNIKIIWDGGSWSVAQQTLIYIDHPIHIGTSSPRIGPKKVTPWPLAAFEINLPATFIKFHSYSSHVRGPETWLKFQFVTKCHKKVPSGWGHSVSFISSIGATWKGRHFARPDWKKYEKIHGHHRCWIAFYYYWSWGLPTCWSQVTQLAVQEPQPLHQLQ